MLTSLLYLSLFLIIAALTFFLTFVFYAAIIKFREIRDSGLLATLSPSVRVIMKAALFLGLLLDALLNFVFLTIYYWEWPRELLSTFRVKRWYWSAEDTRNRRKSIWLAKNFLLPIDPNHLDN